MVTLCGTQTIGSNLQGVLFSSGTSLVGIQIHYKTVRIQSWQVLSRLKAGEIRGSIAIQGDLTDVCSSPEVCFKQFPVAHSAEGNLKLLTGNHFDTDLSRISFIWTRLFKVVECVVEALLSSSVIRFYASFGWCKSGLWAVRAFTRSAAGCPILSIGEAKLSVSHFIEANCFGRRVKSPNIFTGVINSSWKC